MARGGTRGKPVCFLPPSLPPGTSTAPASNIGALREIVSANISLLTKVYKPQS